MTTRQQIVAEAREWLGTPWVHQHQAKGVAVDCAQLVIAIAQRFGLAPADFTLNDYGRNPDGTITRLCNEYADPVKQEDMQPGDIVVVAVEHQPQHMGIVGDYRHGGLSVIHAASIAGKVIETRLVFMRGFRFMAAYKFRGVA